MPPAEVGHECKAPKRTDAMELIQAGRLDSITVIVSHCDTIQG